MHYIPLIGRILFSSVFILKSFDHFSPKMIALAAASGVPAAPFFVPVSGLIVLIAGLSILFGYKAKIGAWVLIVFLLLSSFFMHKFWAAEESFGSMMHSYCFWKNVSLLGAALMMTHFGSGPHSLRQ